MGFKLNPPLFQQKLISSSKLYCYIHKMNFWSFCQLRWEFVWNGIGKYQVWKNDETRWAVGLIWRQRICNVCYNALCQPLSISLFLSFCTDSFVRNRTYPIHNVYYPYTHTSYTYIFWKPTLVQPFQHRHQNERFTPYIAPSATLWVTLNRHFSLSKSSLYYLTPQWPFLKVE